MKTTKKIFLLISIVLVYISCSRTPTIQTIPAKDYIALKEFFETFFKESGAAYTLFGSKPISIDDYDGNDPFSSLTYIMERGWKSWLKYQSFFPSQNFALRKLNLGNKKRIAYREIVLINKQKTLEILQTHLVYIQKRLKTNLSAEDLLINLLKSDMFFEKMIEHSDIFGILLGYGKANAINFQKILTLSLSINEITPPPLHHNFQELSPTSLIFVKGYRNSKLKKDFELESTDLSFLIKELNIVTKKKDRFELEGADFITEKIESPVFSVDLEDHETNSLHQSYCETRIEIEKACKDRDIFNSILQQWMKKQ